MKTKIIVFVVAAVSVALSMTMAMGSLGVNGPIIIEVTAQQQGDQEFDARLAGASEVPPVQTSASGFAELEVEDNGNRVEHGHIC
jgi:hypothetical protein